MAKICAKGKAAAKRKFDVYPSAYANMYASKVCKGKIKKASKGMQVTGSPIDVQIDGVSVTNSSTAEYYKELIK